MLDILLVLFSMYGLTYVLKESSILAPIRSYFVQRSSFMAALLYCYYCVGFWSGIMVYFIYQYAAVLLWPLAGLAVSGLLSSLSNRLNYFPDSK